MVHLNKKIKITVKQRKQEKSKDKNSYMRINQENKY